MQLLFIPKGVGPGPGGKGQSVVLQMVKQVARGGQSLVGEEDTELQLDVWNVLLYFSFQALAPGAAFSSFQ